MKVGTSYTTNPIYDAVKRATVAIVIAHPETIPRKPFTIVGSGFCIHPEGVVVTCEHVFKSFVHPDSYQRVMQAIGGNESETFELKSLVAARRIPLPCCRHRGPYDPGPNRQCGHQDGF